MAKNKNYILQIIPSDSGKTRSFIISQSTFRISLFLILIFFISLSFFGYKSYEMSMELKQSVYLQKKNTNLIKENAEFKMAALKLDSIRRIQKTLIHITQAFLDDDSLALNDSTVNDSLLKEQLEEFMRQNTVEASQGSVPNLKPVEGRLSRKFGITIPEDGTKHLGLDISTQKGTPILSPAPGTVEFTGEKKDLGKVIIIDHGNELKTIYAHLDTILVETNSKISRGIEIGKVGNTGNSSAPHLHYEVILNGIQQNPEDYF